MITIGTSLSARRITKELDKLIEWRGTPEVLRIDNGPEFTSAAFERWARRHKIKLCFIQPGKPTQNSLIERLNGIYRKELLNAHLFGDLDEVRDQTQRWIWNYNNVRPHESLGNMPPVLFNKQRGMDTPSLIIDMQLEEEFIFTTASD